MLGWAPKVELAVGLRRTVAYFDQELRQDNVRRVNARPYGTQVSRAPAVLAEGAAL
jgi:hypothetical protein